MSTFLREINRNIIPRWRDSDVAATTGELEAVKASETEADSFTELEQLVEKWIENYSMPFAADLVSVALVLDAIDNQHVLAAAQYLLSATSGAPEPARKLAAAVFRRPQVEETDKTDDSDWGSFFGLTRQRIRDIRHRLRRDPRNGLLWVNLARQHTTLGADEQARKSMKTALWLAADNRFVLRSAARFYVHVNEPEKAHEILRRNPATRRDPWLRAAEIAVAGIIGKTPGRVKQTKKLLNSAVLPPKHVSELASAVATLELGSGSERSARRLFRLALREPTENAVAQANWAARCMSGIPLTEDHFVLPRSFEARAFDYFRAQAWAKSIDACVKWFVDEPFSSRPVTLGTYTAIVGLEDYETAAQLAKLGLVSDPSDFLMRNNLVVALAELGSVEEAKSEYDKITRPDETEYPCWLATRGLLAFREQFFEAGRDAYKKASMSAREQGSDESQAMVLIHWAREELRSGERERADEIAGQAKKAAQGVSEVGVTMALDRYQDLSEATG